MRLDALDHPKTLDFAARLGVSRPTVLGHLELLWAFTGKMSPQGNIGKWPDGAIARACDWMGDPAAFIGALVGAGFVDANGEHRLLIHDWAEHAPGWVNAKLKKLKLLLIRTSVATEPSEKDGSVATEPDGSAFSARAHVLKGREEKGREVCTHTPESGLNRDFTFVGKVPPTIEDSDLADGFAEFLTHFPKRAVQHSILDEREWARRVTEGHATMHELAAGAARYAKFCAAGGVSGAQFVMAIRQWLDPRERRWLHPWDPPATKGQQQLDSNIAESQEWLARSTGNA